MSEQKAEGSCLCKKVRYEITGNMGVFPYCHCSRCRKITGRSLGRIKALFHETDKYRSSLLCQLFTLSS
jgi:hypothetical protein